MLRNVRLLKQDVAAVKIAGAALVASLVARLYVVDRSRWLDIAPLVAAGAMLVALAAYLLLRHRAKRLLASWTHQQGKVLGQ